MAIWAHSTRPSFVHPRIESARDRGRMLDWLTDADIWVKIGAAVTAAATATIGLLNALTAWRKAHAANSEQSQAPSNVNQLRVLSLQGDPIKPWSLFWVRALLVIVVIFVLPLIAICIWVIFRFPSWEMLWPALVLIGTVGLLAFTTKQVWTADPQRGSKVRRESTINVEGDYDRIWDRCLGALERTGVEVKAADSRTGVIEGTKSMSWASHGEIIVVHIAKVAEGECSVRIKSDSKLATIMIDFGKNASNVRKFFHELTR
jgi:uncharacterized lipoprotein